MALSACHASQLLFGPGAQYCSGVLSGVGCVKSFSALRVFAGSMGQQQRLAREAQHTACMLWSATQATCLAATTLVMSGVSPCLWLLLLLSSQTGEICVLHELSRYCKLALPV